MEQIRTIFEKKAKEAFRKAKEDDFEGMIILCEPIDPDQIKDPEQFHLFYVKSVPQGILLDRWRPICTYNVDWKKYIKFTSEEEMVGFLAPALEGYYRMVNRC